MYPRLSDFFNDVFGWDICLPIQSFGFFMAMAFVVAYLIVTYEYGRQTRLGIFPTQKVKVTKGGPLRPTEILLSGILFAFVGYKFAPALWNYTAFCENPQAAILSPDGSLAGGIILGLGAALYKFWQYRKLKDTQPEEVEEDRGLVHEMGPVFIIAFVAGVLGAKVFHNLEYWKEFLADPVGQLLSFSGLTFYGGLICAATAIIWYIHKKGYKILPFIDTASLVLILGYGIGRIGCQVSGDGDWGIVNTADKPGWLSWAPDWLWAYNYPNNVLKDCGGCANWAETPYLMEPVFPTPVYETTMAFMIFGLLWYLRKRLPYWGQLFSIYLVLNGLERFWIEKIRKNATYEIFGSEITQAEIISSVLILAGFVMLYLTTYVWKQNDKSPETAGPVSEKGSDSGNQEEDRN